MKIGDCLEAYREKNNLTWRSLAKEIGVDRAVLFRLSTQPSTSSETFVRLMSWFLTQSKNNHD